MHIQDKNKFTINAICRSCHNRGHLEWWSGKFGLQLENEGILDMALQQTTYGPLKEFLQRFITFKELATLFTWGIRFNVQFWLDVTATLIHPALPTGRPTWQAFYCRSGKDQVTIFLFLSHPCQITTANSKQLTRTQYDCVIFIFEALKGELVIAASILHPMLNSCTR